MAGPPSTSAVTQIAMKIGAGPVMITCPAPSRPKRIAWRAVATPQTTSATNTAQVR